MFFSRLDYALTHLGWLGFLTGLYFFGLGLWLAHMLWCRSKAGVWQQRSEVFEEYRTLYQRAVENQEELLEACDIHENRCLHLESQLSDAQRKLAESETRCAALRKSAGEDHEAILDREHQIQTLYDQIDQVRAQAEEQTVLARKADAEYQSHRGALTSRIAEFEAALTRAGEEKSRLGIQLTDNKSELQKLRSKYADLMQQFAMAKDQQATYSRLSSEQKSQVDRLTSQITGLESTLDETSDDARLAREQQADANGKLQSLRNKYAELMAQYATAREGEQSYSRLTTQQKTTVDELSSQISGLEKTLLQSAGETQTARHQFEATQSELESLRTNYAQLMQQYTTAKKGEQSFRKIDQEHKSLQSHLQELTEELRSVQEALADREMTCQDLRSEVEKLREELGCRTVAQTQLQKEFDCASAELKQTYETLATKAKIETSLAKANDELQATQKELSGKSKQLNSLQDQHHVVERELADVADQLLSLQGTYDTLKEDDEQTIETLQQQLAQAESKLSELVERPADADDLTEIVGVSRRIEEQLNEIDVFRFKQVALWDGENAIRIEQLLKCPGIVRDFAWVEQANDLLGLGIAAGDSQDRPEPSKPKVTSYVRALRQYGNLSVEIDEKLGVVFAKRPTRVDDLTVIRGVGKVNERCLQENGVYRLQQIADWNEYNIWAFNQLLQFKGRIEREVWVAQARHLVGLPERKTHPTQELQLTDASEDQRRAA